MTDWTPATHTAESDRPKLALTSIHIHRAPGISPGFALTELSPDITVVFGPNASGKSTTARAIQSILWPSPAGLRGHQLSAGFDLDGDTWQVHADAGSIVRTRNGEPAAAPLLAPVDDRTRYTLGLPDLLASENQPLAQAILTESSGGFDLGQAAIELGFDYSIPPRLQAARDAHLANTEARETLDAERDTQRELAHRNQLLAQRDRSQAAERDIEAINAALNLRAREASLREQEAHVQAFAPNVARATGEESSLLAELANRIGEAQANLGEALRLRDNWQHTIDTIGLGDIADPEALRAGLSARNERRQELAAAISTTEQELATAEAERTTHQRRLANDINDDQIASLDADGIRELADIANAYEDIRAQRSARDELELWLGGVEAPPNLHDLTQGVDLLQSRLQHPNAVEHRETTGKVQLAAAIGGLLTIVGGAALGMLVNPWWWALAIVGLVLVLLAWKLAASESPKLAAELERQYAGIALPQPEAWRMANVRDLLGQLREELKVALVEQEKADRWADLEQERKDLDAAYADTESRREEAIAKYGVAPDLQEESLRLLAENLGRWQAADATVRGLEGKKAKLQADDATVESRVRESLALVGYADGDVEEQLADLDRRIAENKDAKKELAVLKSAINSRLQPALDAVTAERDKLYSDLDLEPGDTSSMRSLLEQRERLNAARRDLANRESDVQAAREATAPQWRDTSESELEQSLALARNTAATRAETEQQLARLAEVERAAQRSQHREEANAELANARAELARERERVAQHVVGDVLATGIQQETRDAALPIVFHRARQLFAIITRGKYELQFEAGPPPEFTALDTGSGATLHLDQLSSGTRVQLLMAIRLAFVENVEVGPKLPVLLDETLGNSDEFRAGAIIDAAIDICRNGRQVFYFTAQGEEVARWQQRIESMPADERPTMKVVELAEVRRDAGFDRLPIPVPAESERARIPSPTDYDSATWAAALRVPAIDPWADGVGSTHLWHLVDNTHVLHALLQEDVTTLGQLESLERTSPEQLERIHAELPRELDGIRARKALLSSAISMWRIGKARPMPTGVLADADMIDAVALDEMHALQHEADNNGQTLMDTLQTMDDPPLAEKPMEALELWLISEGYIAQGAEMGMAEMRARIIDVASPHIREDVLSNADVDRVIDAVELW